MEVQLAKNLPSLPEIKDFKHFSKNESSKAAKHKGGSSSRGHDKGSSHQHHHSHHHHKEQQKAPGGGSSAAAGTQAAAAAAAAEARQGVADPKEAARRELKAYVQVGGPGAVDCTQLFLQKVYIVCVLVSFVFVSVF
jgi:hypothetical protein